MKILVLFLFCLGSCLSYAQAIKLPNIRKSGNSYYLESLFKSKDLSHSTSLRVNQNDINKMNSCLTKIEKWLGINKIHKLKFEKIACEMEFGKDSDRILEFLFLGFETGHSNVEIQINTGSYRKHTVFILYSVEEIRKFHSTVKSFSFENKDKIDALFNDN